MWGLRWASDTSGGRVKFAIVKGVSDDWLLNVANC